jgi:hypothetical protein
LSYVLDTEDAMTGKKTTKETEPSTVVANDPNDSKGVLKDIGGSRSDHWNNILANQAINALWRKHSDQAARDQQYKATVAALIGIGPKDELEGMIAAHGGKSPGAPRGNKNAYKHGRYTAEAIANRREIATLLRALKGLALNTTASPPIAKGHE